MADRKARLAALAARAGRSKKTEDGAEKSSICGIDEIEEIADIEWNGSASGCSPEGGGGGTKPALRFRNYAPRDESLVEDGEKSSSRRAKRKRDAEQKAAEGRELSSGAAPTERTPLERALLQAKLDARASSARAVAAVGGGGGSGEDLVAMAPKKVNWDLKRDVKGKIDKLERRTQRAIVELLRERLEREASEGGEDDDEHDDLD
mmetsp:Transcript_57945/g.172934  ORF Transcript_57945/g.172934 Transcript_57945/m.172934 type:complete len:206 (-) Transcript_57945:107-724(-)|eukprot:CAMPEP_0113552212 /NCGR_PEP_ID=MMETSP0015_2-20120614/14943_1 /TAXON_ID=2838 /ORGANISM="Odontella" /LENGTH=205 /DNA_ID=CAMNT_0000453167 /DNA_START=40 /DNA_END=657 /DNA_ORIENTATION=- /assembly_acc=CAM_ASM_000160